RSTATPAKFWSVAPCELSVHAALYFHARWVREAVLDVASMQQILPDQRKFEPIAGTPGETSVEFEVAWHRSGCRPTVGSQRVAPAQRSREFDPPRQGQGGADRQLVLGVGRFVEPAAQVILTRFDAQMFLEQSITAVQRPEFRHLVVAAKFQPIGVALEIIGEVQRQDGGGSEAGAAHIAVLV